MSEHSDLDCSARTVIFVGGTSYSGSTLLDMMLANDPNGLSCGEVYAIFYPYRRHHLELETLGGTIDWRAIKASGPQNLYRNLFEQFPQSRFIVDSSKSPIWISERSAELRSMGMRAENILIWKSPSEFRASRQKRGQKSGWQREWINYHRYYFTLVGEWRSVRYRDLVASDITLPRVCSALGIPYFPKKEQYWNREQHTVFGNDSTRIHLHEKSSLEFAKVRESIESTVDRADLSQHRTISYRPPDEDVAEYTRGLFGAITAALEHNDVLNPPRPGKATDALQMGGIYHQYQVAKLKCGLKWLMDLVGR